MGPGGILAESRLGSDLLRGGLLPVYLSLPPLPVFLFLFPNEGYERHGKAPYRARRAKDFHSNLERAPGVQLKSERGECQPGRRAKEKRGREGRRGGRRLVVVVP